MTVKYAIYDCDINIKLFPNGDHPNFGLNGGFVYIDEQGFVTMNPKSADGEEHHKIGSVSSINVGTAGDCCSSSLESFSYGDITAEYMDSFVDSINCNPFPVPTKTKKKDFTNKFKFLQL